MTPSAAAATFAIAIVAVVIGFVIVTTYNAVVALRNRTRKAWANIDVALKQRHDMLPNLVEAVRGLMAFEQDVLTEVTRARAAYVESDPIPRQAAVSDATTQAVRSLFAVVERYPDLKSNQNFLALQSQLEGTENRIAVERRRYNEAAREYNTAVRRFPGSVVASLRGFTERPYFEATAGSEAPPIKF